SIAQRRSGGWRTGPGRCAPPTRTGCGTRRVAGAAVTGLLGPAEIRGLAGRLGIRPGKRPGQHCVHDRNTVRPIVAAADRAPAPVVLEVGPGLGSLTLALLPAVAHVHAVEIDPVLAGALPATVAARVPARAAALSVHTGD